MLDLSVIRLMTETTLKQDRECIRLRENVINSRRIVPLATLKFVMWTSRNDVAVVYFPDNLIND